MNVFTEEDFDILNNIQFFTAKPDRKGRILIPAPIRRNLGIGYNSNVLLGFEKNGALFFYGYVVDAKGRIYVSALGLDTGLLSVESVDSKRSFQGMNTNSSGYLPEFSRKKRGENYE